MIQRQWRHWLHFVPEVHLSEWFCFLNSQNGHPDPAEIFSSRAMLFLNMPIDQPTKHPVPSQIIYNIFFSCSFGQFLACGHLVSLLLCGSFSTRNPETTGLQSERVRRRARSKLQREAFFYQTCCFRASVGENPFEGLKQCLFDVFEICLFDEETPFLESCRESKSVGHSEGNFLHPTPGCQHNPTLC